MNIDIPAGVKTRLARISALAKALKKAGLTEVKLQDVSEEVTGLRMHKHLHCTGTRELGLLIRRFEQMKEGLTK